MVMAIKKIVLVAFVVLLVLFSGCLQNVRAPNPELCDKVSQQSSKDIGTTEPPWPRAMIFYAAKSLN